MPSPSKRTLAAGSCPPCDTGRKIGAVEMALVWNLLHEDPACPSRVLLDKSAQRQVPIAVSVRHLNRLRVRWHLNRRKGRPRQAARSTPVASDRAVVQVTPRCPLSACISWRIGSTSAIACQVVAPAPACHRGL